LVDINNIFSQQLINASPSFWNIFACSGKGIEETQWGDIETCIRTNIYLFLRSLRNMFFNYKFGQMQEFPITPTTAHIISKSSFIEILFGTRAQRPLFNKV
jgi:hypothetical protein